jgi:hypothetical protein
MSALPPITDVGDGPPTLPTQYPPTSREPKRQMHRPCDLAVRDHHFPAYSPVWRWATSSSARIGDEEIVRIRCETEPALVASRFKDRGYAVVDLTYKIIRRHRDNGEGAFPLSRDRIGLGQRCGRVRRPKRSCLGLWRCRRGSLSPHHSL